MDKVRLKTKSYGIVEGYLMPLTEYNDENSIIVKLKNGYNYAFPKNEIISMEKISSIKEKEGLGKTEKQEIKDIHIISTGGTIASRVDYETGGVKASFKPEEIFATIPEIKDSEPFNKYDYSFEVLMEEMSEDLTPQHWEIISKRIRDVRDKVSKGIIIAHGTDTMHYTSAALSYALSGKINKPVVITGAQRSSDRPSSDAFLNFLASIFFIINGLSPGVYVVMHATSSDDIYYAHLGTRVKKMHTSKRDAFKSINYKPIATAHYDLKNKVWELKEMRKIKCNNKVSGNIKFSDDVALIKYHPGFDVNLLEKILEEKRGIIIEGTGLGHVKVNGEGNLLDVIKRYAKTKFIGMCSQTVYGEVHPYVYANLRKLTKAGVVYLYDMLCEAAYVKLSYAFANYNDLSEVKDFMLSDVCEDIKKVW